MEFEHKSVLLDESLEALSIDPAGIYVDGTAGGAGHSTAIARQLGGGRLISLDKDPQAVAVATRRLAPYPQATVHQADFMDMPAVLRELGIEKVNGILLDLGVSSHQIDTPERGFSYHNDAPLDMRMSGEGRSAHDLVNTLDAPALAAIFRRFGEEKFAMNIARAIERTRAVKPIETTHELVEIIRQSIPAAARRQGGHPAKRVFQALRIAVNGELDSLERALDDAFDLLCVGGRFAVITFHSLEDRMVKRSFVARTKGCTCPPDFPVCVCGKEPQGRLVGKQPILPAERETRENSRSRSAKLRVIERLTETQG